MKERNCQNCEFGQWIKDKYLARKAMNVCEECKAYDLWRMIREIPENER